MSEENVEILQRITAYFNENGSWGPTELYDPEVKFTTRGDVAVQTYTGHPGLVEAMASFRDAWAEIQPHILKLIEGDDVVVADIRFELRSHAGVQLEVEEAWVYWFRDGKVKGVEQHATHAGALEAAGLQK